jgi:hypothetical protein
MTSDDTDFHKSERLFKNYLRPNVTTSVTGVYLPSKNIGKRPLRHFSWERLLN